MAEVSKEEVSNSDEQQVEEVLEEHFESNLQLPSLLKDDCKETSPPPSTSVCLSSSAYHYSSMSHKMVAVVQALRIPYL